MCTTCVYVYSHTYVRVRLYGMRGMSKSPPSSRSPHPTRSQVGLDSLWSTVVFSPGTGGAGRHRLERSGGGRNPNRYRPPSPVLRSRPRGYGVRHVLNLVRGPVGSWCGKGETSYPEGKSGDGPKGWFLISEVIRPSKRVGVHQSEVSTPTTHPPISPTTPTSGPLTTPPPTVRGLETRPSLVPRGGTPGRPGVKVPSESLGSGEERV